ncbi:MAG: ATP-binding protein [Pseudomonadota bacterium]
MTAPNGPFFVLAGPPGAGKTTVLEALRPHLQTVPETARRVLAEERRKGGRATGEQDPALFVSRMLEMAMADYDNASGLTVFDRGLPDLIAFCGHYGFSDDPVRAAIAQRPYRSPVFYLPAWEDIYVKDAERRLDFAGADAFGTRIYQAYKACGYDLIALPKTSADQRCDFILEQIAR